MQVLDYRHSDPSPSPPHNSSWLLDNQPTASPVPHTTSSPPHHSLPLVPSNSLTGISNHHPPPSSTSLRTPSSSTLNPPSHPSHATSDLYPSHHPSAPRGSPLTHLSRLNTLATQDTFNLNTSANNNDTHPPSNSNTHSTLTKFGNLLNVSNVALDHERDHTRIGLSRAASNQPEPYKDIPSHSYANPTHSYSASLEYRPITHAYHEHNQFKQSDNTTSHDRTDPYHPMHRPHFPSQNYSHPNSAHRQDFLDVQQATSYHHDYSKHNSHVYPNNYSPSYPGTAPMPIYKERTYGIPKFDRAIASQNDPLCHTDTASLPSFKPMPAEKEVVSKQMRSKSKSPPTTNSGQLSNFLQDFAVGGTLLRDTIQAFQEKGMNQERADFLRDYTELMKAYEEKCDVVYDSTERTCMELMLKSRVPLLEDTMTAPVDDETPEDAHQKLVVKRKFVEAMEALQGDQLPTKRRGNLPKECTEYLKKWFEDHYDHPYPTDDEKLEMSKQTKIGMSQISHWFINYRKRVWKPSLPPNHPALNGEHTKKPRKKQKTEDDVGK